MKPGRWGRSGGLTKKYLVKSKGIKLRYAWAVKAGRHERILVISDQHFPYSHADTVAFLTKVKQDLRPDTVINIGDEIDGHAISFHGADPDLLAPGDELKAAIEKIKPLYDLFPKMQLVESNHGSLVYRKGKFAGLPRHVFKSYREILGAPKGWTWSFDITLALPTGQHVYFHHGKSANGLKLSQAMGMCVVQGHYHTNFNIQYWANPLGLYWAMSVGCLIDDHSLAFAYNKTTIARPIIGVGAIIEGHPKLIPMVLGKNGRWVGRLV